MASNSGSNFKKPNQSPMAKSTARVVPPVSTNPLLRTREASKKETSAPATFIFGKKNYQFMMLGIGFLIVGFYLMSGTTDIMSTTKIVIAPIIVLIGFAIEFYAILTKPTKAV